MWSACRSSIQQKGFCLRLKSNSSDQKVKASVKATGKDFDRELNNLYVSGPIARALLACDTKFAAGERKRRNSGSQFRRKHRHHDDAFLRTVKDALKLVARDGRIPTLSRTRRNAAVHR